MIRLDRHLQGRLVLCLESAMTRQCLKSRRELARLTVPRPNLPLQLYLHFLNLARELRQD